MDSILMVLLSINNQGGGGGMQQLIYFIYSYFQSFNVLLKKPYFLFNSNKFLLKTNQNYFAYNFCTEETCCCFQTKGNISVSAKMSWKISAYRQISNIVHH